ncbi:hypothetical protein D3C76_612170 [compost metagenome]
MLFIFHVDEVDDDDPADVAQAQLASNGGGRFKVGLEDGLFKVAVAHERAGVDVDGGHRLGRVDHQVAAGLERHLALQGTLDFILDAIQVEDRPLARVMLQAIGNFRHQFADELRGFLERFPRVDADLLDLGVDQVAQRAQGQAEVFVDHRRGAAGLDLAGDLLPQTTQVADVLEDFLGAGTLGGGAQNETPGILDVFAFNAAADHLLEALTLGFILDLEGNAHMAAARHVHQVARRDRQLGGQARALGADRVLGHLHHQGLSLVHQGGDVLYRRAFALGYFRGMDERRALQADVDEGRLHARQDTHHLALVDIADDAAALGALDVHFLQHPVFHHRHA